MKKIVLLIVVLSMMLSLFACQKDNVGDGESNSQSADVGGNGGGDINLDDDQATSDDPYVKYEKDDLPEDLNYNEYDFTILCDREQYGKSFADTYTGDVINSALFERMATVESRLNVKLDVVREAGAYSNMGTFAQKLSLAGSDFDLVLSYNLTPATMASQGLIRDIKSTQYINFDKPWWSKELLQNVTINDKVYFTADNSSWNNIRNMLGLFVDKELFLANHSDMTIDDLYDLVENDQWTMAKMFELVKDTRDDDGLTGDTDGDIYGLSLGHPNWIEAFYYGAGFKTLSANEAGEWSFEIGSQSSINFVDWFVSEYHGNESVKTNDPTQYDLFKNSRSMFYVSALSMVEQKLTQEFTVLPIPMYDIEQGGYKTHFSNTYDMYSIPTAATDPNRSAAVLECLASEAYRRIGPAYFDVYLKKQNASDARLPKMYDIIREGIVFDMGYIFGSQLDMNDGVSDSGSPIDDFPVYYVRRSLIQFSGWENLGAKWTESVNLQHLNKWQTSLDAIEAAQNNG